MDEEGWTTCQSAGPLPDSPSTPCASSSAMAPDASELPTEAASRTLPLAS
jgi:hypothetical protein